jgi:chemotaxis protein MotB
VDNLKINKLSNAIRMAFQDLGMFQTSAPSPKVEDVSSVVPQWQMSQAANYNAHSQPEQIRFSEELRRALAIPIREGKISIRETQEGTVISLRELGFFATGSAVLLDGSQPLLAIIAKTLRKNGYQVRVEGNTDSVPIHNDQFRSNWELSNARAVAVLEALLTYGSSPSRISAAGYAEYRPLASNDSEQGRAQNRRVDLVVLNAMPSPASYATPNQAIKHIAVLPALPTVMDQ